MQTLQIPVKYIDTTKYVAKVHQEQDATDGPEVVKSWPTTRGGIH